jgi:hypothetical protein
VGLEASQVRQEAAVNRHFRLSCVAQSLLPRAPAGGRQSERFAFAEDHQQTVGQKLYTLTRDALGQLVQLVQGLFAQEQSDEQVLERLMPACSDAALNISRLTFQVVYPTKQELALGLLRQFRDAQPSIRIKCVLAFAARSIRLNSTSPNSRASPKRSACAGASR